MINKKLLTLDCTFRDGGYYNNWNFDINLFNQYINCMNLCKIDFVEIGFRFIKIDKFIGPFGYTTEKFLSSLELPRSIKYSVMINAKEYINNEDNIFEVFSKKNKSKISLVRIAINFDDYKSGKILTENLKKLGYSVGFNLMQAHDKNSNKCKVLTQEISSWKTVDYLYFADSLGCMKPNDINKLIINLKKNWKGNLGIHAHNNKNLALINTTTAINSGIDICDSTILGMGRGAGNTETENLMIEIKKIKNHIQAENISKVSKLFKILKSQYDWGSNFLYNYSADMKIHPTYVQNLLQENRYTEKEVFLILQNLSKLNVTSFSSSKINDYFYFNQKELKQNNNLKIPIIKKFKNSKALILGNGNSLKTSSSIIKKTLNKKNLLKLFLNTNLHFSNNQADFTIIVNTMRILFEENKFNYIKSKIIAPVKSYKKVFRKSKNLNNALNYDVCIQSNVFKIYDNFCILPSPIALAYAIAILIQSGINNIYLAGIDGYHSNKRLHNELVLLLKSVNSNYPNVNIYSLTPTLLKIKLVKNNEI